MRRTFQEKIDYCYSAARRNWDDPKGERWYMIYEYFRRKQALYNQVN